MRTCYLPLGFAQSFDEIIVIEKYFLCLVTSDTFSLITRHTVDIMRYHITETYDTLECEC